MTDILREPLTWALTAVGAVVGLLQGGLLGPLWGALWASSGELFSLVSLGALTLPPHIPPQGPTDWLVLSVGGLFASRVAQRAYQEFDKRF